MSNSRKPNTKKTRMYDRIRQHGENLKEIFGLSGDPVALSKKVLRLENEAHRAAEGYANGTTSEEKWATVRHAVLKRLDAILHFRKNRVTVFVNGDPRGYALKIEDSEARHMRIYRDMGGYGILAPDFRE